MYNKSHKLLISALHWLRTVRNACAHNERIYTQCRENGRINEYYISKMSNKSYTKDRSQRIFDLLVYLKYFLSPSDYNELIINIKELLKSLETKVPLNPYQYIMGELGVKNIDDLDELILNPNEKDYANFSKS